MNLHIETGLGIKSSNYVWDPNSDVENGNFLTDFSWLSAKNTKIKYSSESVKTKEHKKSKVATNMISQ